jgi:hypothetical protein
MPSKNNLNTLLKEYLRKCKERNGFNFTVSEKKDLLEKLANCTYKEGNSIVNEMGPDNGVPLYNLMSFYQKQRNQAGSALIRSIMTEYDNKLIQRNEKVANIENLLNTLERSLSSKLSEKRKDIEHYQNISKAFEAGRLGAFKGGRRENIEKEPPFLNIENSEIYKKNEAAKSFIEDTRKRLDKYVHGGYENPFAGYEKQNEGKIKLLNKDRKIKGIIRSLLARVGSLMGYVINSNKPYKVFSPFYNAKSGRQAQKIQNKINDLLQPK